jgi:hypothetical protein
MSKARDAVALRVVPFNTPIALLPAWENEGREQRMSREIGIIGTGNVGCATKAAQKVGAWKIEHFAFRRRERL